MENTTTSSSTTEPADVSPTPIEAMAYASRTLANSVDVLAGTIESLSDTGAARRQPLAPPVVKETDVNSKNVAPSHVLGAYGKYVAMFVGAGLISGSLVHFPLAPSRYLMIGACGAALFTIGSVVGELRSNRSSPGRVFLIIIASLALSIGIGMVSGGIQHFQDFPARAAKLIPLGIGLSVGAFVMRHGYKLRAAHFGWLAAGTISVMAMSGIGLNAVAESSTPSADHHGSETPVTTSADPNAPTPTSTTSAPTAGSH